MEKKNNLFKTIKDEDNIIEIYTDGACSGNPGKGAWSCIVYNKDKKTIYEAYVGYEDGYDGIHAETYKDTTNNRMEIKGLLKALELSISVYKDKVCLIYSDSAYCVNMFNDWINNWAKNGWTNSKKEIVKNFDLVKKLYEYKKIDFPNFQVLKIEGHNSNNIGNELADAYAVSAKDNNSTKLVKIIKENEITLSVE